MMRANIMSEEMVEKLNCFNWESEQLRPFKYGKFAINIIGCCFLLSCFVIAIAEVIDTGSYWGALICVLVMHFFIGIVTIGILEKALFMQAVLAIIEPKSDILYKIESEKRKYTVYGFRVGVVFIAIAICINLLFVLYSGVVMALSGVMFAFFWAYKTVRLFPDEFKNIVSEKLPSRTISLRTDTSLPSRKFNPATGLPMLNKSIDVAGNAFGSRSRR